MPVTIVYKLKFLQEIGKEGISDEDFFQLCFDMGLEMDGVTSEKLEKSKSAALKEGEEPFTLEQEDPSLVQYKIEVAANRYDLLCHQGLVRAFKEYLGSAKARQWRAEEAKETLTVEDSVADVRAVVVCGVLRGIKFTQQLYDEFIQLQDKLHQTICRRRALASIGTHDLDKIQGPFVYKAVAPESFSFVPLQRKWMTEEMRGRKYNGKELMELLEGNDKALRKYLHLIRDGPLYPVIVDSRGEVLSVPPIINGDYSKMSVDTRNVFIEVTATDATKANIVLNTMLTMFADHAESIEKVNVGDAVTPQLEERGHLTDIAYINSYLGLELDATQVTGYLERMGFNCEPSEQEGKLLVRVPVTRSDVMHDVDIVEDVAIAYGYNNLTWRSAPTNCFGSQVHVNSMGDQLRAELAHAGYAEVLTESLVSRAENFEWLGRPDTGAVTLYKPKTIEFEVGRTSLLPCLLKCLRTNGGAKLPIRMFEVSDVMLLDESVNVGARNERRVIAVSCDRSAVFEQVHGLLDKVFEILSLTAGYSLVPDDKDPALFPGRQATIVRKDNNVEVGSIGVVHPRVLVHFNIKNPVGVFELQFEKLLN